MSIADPRAAARSALAAYLTTQLAGVVISKGWPTPQQKLVVPAVTVLTSNQVKTDFHKARLWKVTPTTGINATALYSYGRAEINVQLDAWEEYEVRRDALSARLETCLNRDPQETLDPDPTRVVGYSRCPGLVLRLPDFYNVPAEFIFEGTPADLKESSQSAIVADWRATFSGRVLLHLMDQDTVALMQTVVMQIAINGDTAESVQLAP